MTKGFLRDIDNEEKKLLYQIITERPQQVSHYKRLAELMRADGQYQGAVAILKEALKAHPGDKNVRYHLAKTYYESGEIAKALKAFKSLIKDYPEDYVHYEKLEKMCRENGLIDTAVRIYQGIARDNKLKERSFQRLHYLLVEKLNDMPRGVKNLDDAIRLFGPDYRRSKNLGRLHGKRGDWKKAARCYQKALEFKKDDSDLASLIGWALVESGQLKKAEKYFLMIRGSFQGMTSLAELYLKLGRLKDAESRLKTAARLYPSNARVQIGYAQLHLLHGEVEKARDLAESALSKVPSYFAYEQARAHEVLEEAYEQIGEPGKAAAHSELARALRKGPDTYTAISTLAENKIASGKLDDAERVLKRLLDLYPGNTRGLIDQCEIQLLRSDPGQAVHYGEAGLRGANPKYREEMLKGHILLEQAYDLLEDYENSRRHREKAAELKAGK